MGIPGDLSNKRVTDAEKKILDIAKKYDKVAGIHVVDPNPNLVSEKRKMGYNFIAVGTDFLYLGNSCINVMKKIRKGRE